MKVHNLTDAIDLIKSDIDSKQLHRHQVEAIESMDKYFDLALSTRQGQNGLLVMPTGSGKTFTAVNWLLDRAVAQGFKILWLVHRQELIDQTDTTFRKQASILVRHGFKKLRIIPVSGGHCSISQASRYNVNICGIGSVASKNGMRYLRRLLGTDGKEKLIVVIDEAHHAVSPSYKKVLQKISELNPRRILLGLTATPYRMQESEQAQLFKMFNVNENIIRKRGTGKGYIFEVTLQELLLAGFLAKPIYKRVETQINGDIEFDFTEEDETFFSKFGELSEHLKEQLAKSTTRNQAIINEYIKNKDKYGKTLVFAVNRLHCVTLAKAFTDAGILCRYCISGEPGVQETIADYKANKFDVLINVQILTEGSDVPDIQTVFLTRQTNSDSLLMQMIGRGLRGTDAGGTESAYIIDFHDTWEKFKFWLDPKQLILDEFGEVVEIQDESDDQIRIEQNPEVEGIDNYSEMDYSLWDLYLKMYNTMKVNATGISYSEVFPNGWYVVVNNEGVDEKILVYDNQMEGYELISKNIEKLLKSKKSVQTVIKEYFDIEENLPSVDELKLILDFLYETGEMPTYYTFKHRDEVDVKKIAKEILEKDLRPSEQERWLTEIYERKPILRQLYKSFSLFRNSIDAALTRIRDGDKVEPQTISIDEREDYNIVEGYLNLDELYSEVYDKWFSDGIKPAIRWSNKPLRSRYGLCTKYEDGSYAIVMNKLLCSPDIDPEVIKYIIYHELLHANGYWGHNEAFRSEEWKYPNSDELDGFLDELFLLYKIDEIVPPRNRHK